MLRDSHKITKSVTKFWIRIKKTDRSQTPKIPFLKLISVKASDLTLSFEGRYVSQEKAASKNIYKCHVIQKEAIMLAVIELYVNSRNIFYRKSTIGKQYRLLRLKKRIEKFPLMVDGQCTTHQHVKYP